MPTTEEILTLDMLTLREHTELAGDTLDPNIHRLAVEKTLQTSEAVALRRNGALIAYATLQPQEEGCWFVTGFNTHPDHRTAPIFLELFTRLHSLALQHGITALRSNVYKTNRLSMAFHKRLGFKVTRENSKGVEFYATLAELAANNALKFVRSTHRDTPAAARPLP